MAEEQVAQKTEPEETLAEPEEKQEDLEEAEETEAAAGTIDLLDEETRKQLNKDLKRKRVGMTMASMLDERKTLDASGVKAKQ